MLAWGAKGARMAWLPAEHLMRRGHPPPMLSEALAENEFQTLWRFIMTMNGVLRRKLRRGSQKSALGGAF